MFDYDQAQCACVIYDQLLDKALRSNNAYQYSEWQRIWRDADCNSTNKRRKIAARAAFYRTYSSLVREAA